MKIKCSLIGFLTMSRETIAMESSSLSLKTFQCRHALRSNASMHLLPRFRARNREWRIVTDFVGPFFWR